MLEGPLAQSQPDGDELPLLAPQAQVPAGGAGVHEGFAIRDLSVRRINRKWGEVLVPKCGWVRFRATRQWADICAATSARVTLDRAGRWSVSFTAPPPAFERTPTGAVVGLDMGVVATVTTSDGNHLKMPELLSPGEAQRKRRLQRRLARQEKGSNRRARTKHQIATLSARETDRRKDWVEKTTTALVRDYDVICIEDLKVQNMVRSAKGTVESPGKNVRQKAGLNRSISSQAWALFRRRLSDKATNATSPVELVVVNPAYTSQRCSECGYTAAENRESQAVFRCRACGYSANADVNAAKNIRAAGLAVTGRGGTPHGQPTSAARSGPMKRQPTWSGDLLPAQLGREAPSFRAGRRSPVPAPINRLVLKPCPTRCYGDTSRHTSTASRTFGAFRGL